MNINSGDLPRTLERESASGALSPIWIILDNEPLLALEAGDLLRDNAKSLGYTERVSLGYSATSDWSGLLDALTSVSLFDSLIPVAGYFGGPKPLPFVSRYPVRKKILSKIMFITGKAYLSLTIFSKREGEKRFQK